MILRRLLVPQSVDRLGAAGPAGRQPNGEERGRGDDNRNRDECGGIAGLNAEKESADEGRQA